MVDTINSSQMTVPERHLLGANRPTNLSVSSETRTRYLQHTRHEICLCCQSVVLNQLSRLLGWVDYQCCRFLEPYNEIVKDAVASNRGNIDEHFGLIKNKFEKFVELKFEFFSSNTSHVSEIFRQRIVQARPNTVIFFSLRDCAGVLIVGYSRTQCGAI